MVADRHIAPSAGEHDGAAAGRRRTPGDLGHPHLVAQIERGIFLIVKARVAIFADRSPRRMIQDVIDVGIESGNATRVRAFVTEPTGGLDQRRSRLRDMRERREPLAPFRQLERGGCGDGPAVHSAAQHRRETCDPAQPVGDRAIKHGADRLYMLARIGSLRQPGRRRIPARDRALAVGGEADVRARLDALDAREKAGGPPHRHEAEQVADCRRIGGTGDFGKRVEPLGHGGEGERVGHLAIEERPPARTVADQVQLARLGVPDGKGEVAVQPRTRGGAPGLPGGEDQGGIGQAGQPRGRNAQIGRQ